MSTRTVIASAGGSGAALASAIASAWVVLLTMVAAALLPFVALAWRGAKDAYPGLVRLAYDMQTPGHIRRHGDFGDGCPGRACARDLAVGGVLLRGLAALAACEGSRWTAATDDDALQQRIGRDPSTALPSTTSSRRASSKSTTPKDKTLPTPDVALAPLPYRSEHLDDAPSGPWG
jgi:hypothetical protein